MKKKNKQAFKYLKHPQSQSQQSEVPDYMSAIKFRWLVVSVIALTSIITSSWLNNHQQTRIAANQSPQAEICHKFNRGEVKSVDIATLGAVPGLEDISTALQRVQIETAKSSVAYTETHPVMMKLQEEQTALSSVIQQRVESACQVFE